MKTSYVCACGKFTSMLYKSGRDIADGSLHGVTKCLLSQGAEPFRVVERQSYTLPCGCDGTVFYWQHEGRDLAVFECLACLATWTIRGGSIEVAEQENEQ